MLSLILALTLHAGAATCIETLEKGPPPPGTTSIYDNRRFMRHVQREVAKLQDRHGREAGVYVFDIPFEWRLYRKQPVVPFYVVTDPALITAALRSPALVDRRYPFSPSMRIKAGADSLLVVSDSDADMHETWTLTHDVMMPFFTPRWVRTVYTEHVRNEAIALAKSWRTDHVVNRDLENFTIANVLRPIFGMDRAPEMPASFSRELNEFFVPTEEDKMYRARRTLEEVVRPAVERARNHPEEDGLIQQLLKTGKPESYVYDQLITTYFAGQLTTKVMLGMAFHFLAVHPEWQPRLRAEYQEYADGSRTLDDLPLLTNFLNETLRRYPPVPTLSRYTTKRVQLGNYVIPAGQVVDLNVYAALHDPRVWGEDANEFRPERWEGRRLRNGDFCPFGWGPRICIGQHLAMLEGKLLLGEVLLRSRVETAAPFKTPDAYMGSGLVYLDDLKLRFAPL